MAISAGCLGSSSASHPTLTEKQALREARSDGLSALRMPPSSWQCRGFEADQGPAVTTGRYASYTRDSYAIELDDKRVPPAHGNVARIGMVVVVFPNASIAGRCARAALHETDHLLVLPASARTRVIRHRMISPVTIETHMRAFSKSPYPSDGEYDTYIARGRVLAEGLAYTGPTSRIVEDNLNRVASEIAG